MALIEFVKADDQGYKKSKGPPVRNCALVHGAAMKTPASGSSGIDRAASIPC
jgi:hypothetical protein